MKLVASLNNDNADVPAGHQSCRCHCMYSFYYMYMYVLLTIELALGGGCTPLKYIYYGGQYRKNKGESIQCNDDYYFFTSS